MSRDLYSVVAALVVHTLLGVAIWQAPLRIKRGPNVVQFDVKRREPPPPPAKLPEPPPPPPKVEPPPPPPPPVKHVKRQPTPVPEAPVPNQTPPKEPPKEPPKPQFGVSMSSTTEGDSTFSVPVGNTTIADPKHVGRPSEAKPLPAAPPASAPAPVWKPASALEIRDFAETDESSCQIPDRLYPEEMREQGIEGDTQLRVEIDATGRVHSAKVLSGPARPLNDLALSWMKTRCRFKPARNTAGQPCNSTITYTFHFQLNK